MIRRIMVALDQSAAALKVFDAAVEVATQFGAPLYLFRALEVPPEFPPAAHVAHGDELPGYLEREAREQLRAFVRGVEGLSVGGFVVRVGQPWRAILAAADEVKADLIVIGSHRYQGLDHLFGTIAGQVANRAHQNVLVVHDEAQAA